MSRWQAVLAICILVAARPAMAVESELPEVPERMSVGVGIQGVSFLDEQKQYFGEPSLGAVLFGEWRASFVGIMSEGSITRILGEDLEYLGIPIEIPDLWLFNIGLYTRLYPVDWLYAGPGVAVFSSSNDLEDEIGWMLTGGIQVGPVDLGARYKLDGVEILELRLMFVARRR